ncbi:mucin-21 isoform X2 [Mycetomoellerius zeteki]|uniref:mucin-21 isoform X2 n=1 Tax=Mycetomoellerius zeteki TaxID=64791 RepID=UPI00084EC2A9|nr:PREDICTED: mucin-21-like isoform X2 [Trachymyrmex zeteki]
MSNFTVKELKQQLKSRNLPVTGLKADLINRLQINSSYQSYTNSSYTRGSKKSELWDFTVLELKEQLRARNLPVTGIKADLINRLQANVPYQSQTSGLRVTLHRQLQTMGTDSNCIITAYEKPTIDGKFTHTKTVAHTTNSTNFATRTFTDVNKIRFEDTKIVGAAKVTNAAARNSTDINLIRFEDTNVTAGATKATNATAEAKTVANATDTTNAARSSTNIFGLFEDTKKIAGATEAMSTTTEVKPIASATKVMNMATGSSVNDNRKFLFGYPRPIANTAKATNAAAKSSTNMYGSFEDTKMTAEDKTVASTSEATNATAKTPVNMNLFQFGNTKTTAGAAEAMNAAARSSTNMNVIRFEDIKTTADATEATNTTAEAKAVANATEETKAAVKSCVDYIFQFGKAKTIASAAEAMNATRNFTDVNTIEGTKMAVGVPEAINATKYSIDVHMIWREAELYRREKELAERELMLARREIEMLRQALINTATRPQKICCCFEKISLEDEDCNFIPMAKQDRCNCKQRPEHKDRRHQL